MSADPEVPPLVRIHSECFTGDVLRSERCDCRPQLLEVVRRITQVGALPLYLRQEDRGISLYANLDAYRLQDAGLDTYDANLALGYSEDGRDYTGRGADAGCPGAGPGSPAEQQPGQGSPAGPAWSHRRGAGADRGASQRDQRSLPGHEGRQRRTLDLPCDDVLDAEA